MVNLKTDKNIAGVQNKKVQVKDLGVVDYAVAHEMQQEYFDKVVAAKLANRDAETPAPTPNFALVCEHPHVFTLGRNGKKEHLLISDEELIKHNATFYEIGRGGDITYHGPGQLVVYPIIDLDNFFTDIHKYLRLLEEAVIRTLGGYGIPAGRIDGLTGVWLDFDHRLLPDDVRPEPRKICAFGVRASRWVTMHGLALNVNADLSFFKHIVPCGISDKAVTSMQHELSEHVDIENVKKRLLFHLRELFGFDFVS